MTIAILFGLAIVAAIIWRLNWQPAPSDRIPKDKEDDLRKSDGNTPTPQAPKDTLEPYRYCPECRTVQGRKEIHWHAGDYLDQFNPYWRKYFLSQPNLVIRDEHTRDGGPGQIGFWTEPLVLWAFPEEMVCLDCGEVHHSPYDMRMGYDDAGDLGLVPVCTKREGHPNKNIYLAFTVEDTAELRNARNEGRRTPWEQAFKDNGSARAQMKSMCNRY